MRVRTLRARWEPFAEPGLDCAPIYLRMELVLARWLGTKYGSGQRCRGELADCVGFVFGAIDDLDGRPRASSAAMPADTALHDPSGAAEALRALRDLYQPVSVVEGPGVQPFDILVVGPAGGGPSHAMLVGPGRSQLWHCTPGAGVHQAGWCLGDGYEIMHGAFRISDRRRWLE